MTGSRPRATDTTSPPTLVAGLARRTKVQLLSGAGLFEIQGLPEHGLDGIDVADGPHGLRHQARRGDHLGLGVSTPSTCFPTAATLGSTWDVDLVEAVGAALGREAAEQGVAVVLGPGLNIKRHPAGGRSFEYLSEDPFLGGKLAAAMVRGIQAQGIGACLKHYAVNNQESHRLVVDAVVDERTLRELYLAGFELAVAESAPWTVMCSYNLVNGIYASEHHELLQTILRDEWGFGGVVMTDWGAANDRVAGVKAGLDLEMPGSGGAFDDELMAALGSGQLTDDELDACAARVVELLQRARRDRPTKNRPAGSHDPHHQLGRTAAAAGSVLLTNDGTLPVRPGPAKRIAVIGAFAEHPRYQGAGSSQVRPTHLDRALDLIRARLADDAAFDGVEIAYAPGFDAESGASDPTLRSDAITAADGADLVLFFGGLPAPMESEGFDRATLDLPAGQVALIETLAAGRAPLVVVLSNGGVVHMPWADRVAGVLECWLGGQAGAGGIIDVLFGDAEPGGRLAESIPVNVAHLPADRNFPGMPRQVEYREASAVGYRFHDADGGVPARFPFGHGLSFTSFAWTGITVEGTGTDVTVRVRVANNGPRSGSDVVQVYVRDRSSSVPRPDKELKGFAKVHLGSGGWKEVSIPLDRRAFAVWDVASHDWLVEPGVFDIVVARSSVDIEAEIVHLVESDDVVTPVSSSDTFVMTDAEFTERLGRPIPKPRPTRPFDRNSTLEDLETTGAGRLLSKQVVRVGLSQATKEFPNPDAATQAMIRAALREGPARGVVLLSGGRLRFSTLDSVLAAFNRDARGATHRDLRQGPATPDHPNEATMDTFTHRGRSVRYRDVGQGPSIVMLHNGGTSSTIWRHQVEALSADHRVIAVDLPGFGSSPRPVQPANLNDLVDLIGALIDDLALAPALLVGNCMGSNISVSLARTRPEVVAGILAVNPLTDATFSAGGIGFLHTMADVAAVPTRVLRSLSRKLRTPRPAGVATLRFQLGSIGVERNLHHDPELLACLTRADQMPALVDVLDDMSSYGDADREQVPADVPVWIVWGEQNRVLSRRKGAHLTDRFHATRVEVLAGCGHLPMLEDPDSLNTLIDELDAVIRCTAPVSLHR